MSTRQRGVAMPSFFADIVIPSMREAISCTMSVTVRSCMPGSRVRMNQAFSAKRQASRNSGMPAARHTADTARRFSRETG